MGRDVVTPSDGSAAYTFKEASYEEFMEAPSVPFSATFASTEVSRGLYPWGVKIPLPTYAGMGKRRKFLYITDLPAAASPNSSGIALWEVGRDDTRVSCSIIPMTYKEA